MLYDFFYYITRVVSCLISKYYSMQLGLCLSGKTFFRLLEDGFWVNIYSSAFCLLNF